MQLFLCVDKLNNGFNSNLLDIIALISIILGIYTIISKNPVVSVLFLIGLFSTISIYLILIGLTFIGLSYLLVYIGAVSILFLFILMLINIRISELVSTNNNYIPLAILSMITLVYILGQKIITNIIQYNILNSFSFSFFEKSFKESINYSNSLSWDTNLIDITHISAIGNVMYSSYSLWLIIISLILLLAMVGSIVISIGR
uniref:NADH-ubiquinone oxidoreductase chain 6 n=1 Tax=Arthroderma otae TaxID=63405 RepID=C5HA88_ARTOT|nr:NADH dehydrogenase subunit 6 [Microsporum canis]YP_010951045.1 NADH dehydrogenase subunit 6 [Microsporum ferrugineum]ACR19628.1 NADH dehydrogenase subunit 6 [Microsporum canis]WML69441.1 NADH dehydrogenase subunit 6 [Microsporum ferrugineum]